MTRSETARAEATQRVLDAAEPLFYAAGVRGVGIDAVVARAGVATKTVYTLFGSKQGLVEACLRRRDRRWIAWLTERTARAAPGRDRTLAVFEALGEWFAEPGFTGCAFINVAGELHTDPAARAVAREHKRTLRALLRTITADVAGAADRAVLADALMLLVEGAIVTAHVEGDPHAAVRARAAAAALLESCDRPRTPERPG